MSSQGISLGGATLNLASNRSDNYGVLRVLIQNSGTSAGGWHICGPAPKAPLRLSAARTTTSRIVYDAATGQFGTGNDVALASTTFNLVSATAAAVVISEHSSTETILDAFRTTVTTTKTLGRYQLSPILSDFDPEWRDGNPTITYTSLDPTIATVDSASGLVTFQTSGTSRIVATASEEGQPDQTFELRLTGSVVGGESTAGPLTPVTIRPQNTSQYVLGSLQC